MRLSKSIQSINSTVNYSQLQTPFLSWSFSFHWNCVLQAKVTALPTAFGSWSTLVLYSLLKVPVENLFKVLAGVEESSVNVWMEDCDGEKHLRF